MKNQRLQKRCHEQHLQKHHDGEVDADALITASAERDRKDPLAKFDHSSGIGSGLFTALALISLRMAESVVGIDLGFQTAADTSSHGRG